MKPFIVIVSLLLAFSALHAEEPQEKFPNFALMDKDKAATVARKQAETDFASGKYRILVFGLVARSPAEERLTKAGVETKAIAGCIVSDGIIEGARVYNEIMREKLKAKLGHDVFSDKEQPDKKAEK